MNISEQLTNVKERLEHLHERLRDDEQGFCKKRDLDQLVKMQLDLVNIITAIGNAFIDAGQAH